MASADFEESRLRKIQENREKLQALGLKEAARGALEPSENAQQDKQSAKRKRAPATPASVEKRASERTKNVVINYNEDQNDHLLRGLPRRGSGNGSRSGYSGPRALDDDDAYHARLEAGIVLQSRSLDCTPSKSGVTSVPSSSARKRGPQDSGKGVRVMGGKVYDSKYGVTCHWCRQKTLCESVTCTAPSCGERRMPYSFCRSCLLNRHGEDWQLARDSGCWVCPPCRGTCGAGCTLCCNCGPCRKKAGLDPTGQVKSQAIADGFDNVHDWLVFKETGDSAAALVIRKWEAPWATWLTGGLDGEKEENANASNCVDNEKLPVPSRNNSCPGEAPAEQEEQMPDEEDREEGALDDGEADEPPRKAARSQKQTAKATKKTAVKSKKKTAVKKTAVKDAPQATPDAKVASAEEVPLAGAGILAASPAEDQALPDKRSALEPRRLDFSESADDEGCMMLPVGTAPAGSNETKTAEDCYDDLKTAPKRPASRRTRKR